MDARRHPALRLALLLAVLLVPSGARGQGGELGTEWQPVDPARLAQMRGGFQMPSGMMLSFGIERVVFLNGELTARIAVQIPDVARITPAQAQAAIERIEADTGLPVLAFPKEREFFVELKLPLTSGAHHGA